MVQIKRFEVICSKNDRARAIVVEISQILRISMVFGGRFEIPAMGTILGPRPKSFFICQIDTHIFGV